MGKEWEEIQDGGEMMRVMIKLVKVVAMVMDSLRTDIMLSNMNSSRWSEMYLVIIVYCATLS